MDFVEGTSVERMNRARFAIGSILAVASLLLLSFAG